MSDAGNERVYQPHPGLGVRQVGDLVVLTLTDPARRNAQTPSLWAALREVGSSMPETVRVVVLRAEGRSFSSGLDRAMLTPGGVPGELSLTELVGRGDGNDQEQLLELIAGFQEAFTIWSRIPAVSIAAVQGHAVGAGLQLALACDLRVVADDVQLAMRETTLGLVPDLGGTLPLVRLVGYARALEICATGRAVGAAEAVQTGLATSAVARDELDAAAYGLAGMLLEVPAAALLELKKLLQHAVGASPDEQLRAEREAQARLLSALLREQGK